MEWKEALRAEAGPTNESQLEKFIETEIIEKLIEEIPDEREDFDSNPKFLKQQLRAKWLGNPNIIAGIDFGPSLDALDKLTIKK